MFLRKTFAPIKSFFLFLYCIFFKLNIMAYTTTIYDPKQGLEKLSDNIEKFNIERFTAAMNYKSWNDTEIEIMAREVNEYRIKLEKEHLRLIEYAKTFNQEFATDNNQCFNTALKLLRKLRCGISEVKRIYKKFCPRPPRHRFYYTATATRKPSAFEYSYLAIDSFQLSLFPLDSEIYSASVRGLYNELGKFFHQLSLSLALCMKVMEDEEKIRKDNDYCNYLFEKFKKEVMSQMTAFLSLFPSEAECFQVSNNPAIASLNSYSSTKAWAPFGFHKFCKNDVKLLVIKEVMEEEKRGKYTKEELLLFGNDPKRIDKSNNIIYHFDELMPDNYQRKKLDGKIIAMFMRWCGITNEEIFVKYFNKKYLENPNHAYMTISKSAINTAKNKLPITDPDDKLYKAFVEKLNNMRFIGNTIQQKIG